MGKIWVAVAGVGVLIAGVVIYVVAGGDDGGGGNGKVDDTGKDQPSYTDRVIQDLGVLGAAVTATVQSAQPCQQAPVSFESPFPPEQLLPMGLCVFPLDAAGAASIPGLKNPPPNGGVLLVEILEQTIDPAGTGLTYQFGLGMTGKNLPPADRQPNGEGILRVGSQVATFFPPGDWGDFQSFEVGKGFQPKQLGIKGFAKDNVAAALVPFQSLPGPDISLFFQNFARKTPPGKNPTLEDPTGWAITTTGPLGSCVDPNLIDPSKSCIPPLQDDRFKVDVDWGNQPAFQEDKTDDFFFFHTDNNFELLVKVLDGCSFNNNYWVFYGATTNVEFTLTVTDTQTGTEKTYGDFLGQPSPAITDTQAFATCP